LVLLVDLRCVAATVADFMPGDWVGCLVYYQPAPAGQLDINGLLTNILSALGSSSWVSWMAALVPHRLRGRYFGFRNSAGSLTTLLSVPLFGFAVSAWPSGTMVGYGVVFLGLWLGS